MSPRAAMYFMAITLTIVAVACIFAASVIDQPPVVAPIDPTGVDAEKLYLRP